MRGFRGSRAAQAFNARFNRNHGRPDDRKHGPQPQGQGPVTAQRPELPDWLKTPETKAQEAGAAQNPVTPSAPKAQLKLVPQPPAPEVKAETARAKAPVRKAAAKTAAKKTKSAPAARKTSSARLPKKKAS
jgi:hypothetical protein